MKSASEMSIEIRAKKKAMQEQEVNKLNPDDIALDSEEEAADSAHGELMADAHDRAHETEEPMSHEVDMMAEGGEMKPDKIRIVRPDKGFGAVTMIEDAPMSEMEKRRRDRLKKMMNK